MEMTDVVKQANQGSSEDVGSVGGGKRLEFSIVPVRALPLVAVVIAGLIASIAGNWLWGLDFYHVVGGGLWTAIELFVQLDQPLPNRSPSA